MLPRASYLQAGISRLVFLGRFAGNGSKDAGLLDVAFHRGLFRVGLQLRSCMPEVEVTE